MATEQQIQEARSIANKRAPQPSASMQTGLLAGFVSGCLIGGASAVATSQTISTGLLIASITGLTCTLIVGAYFLYQNVTHNNEFRRVLGAIEHRDSRAKTDIKS